MLEKLEHIFSRRSQIWSLFIFTGIVLYGFTLGYPFVFDSAIFLENNPLISTPGVFRELLDLDKFLAKYLYRLEYFDLAFSFVLRPVAYITFRLNYLIGGQHPESYRIFNIAVHIFNAIMLYELLRFIISQRNDVAASICKTGIPFFAALLFLVHPLQTDSVTCVIQRFTSLGVFFYLGTMLLYLRSTVAGNTLFRRLAYAGSIIALIMGLLTKEIVMTVPFALVMIDVILLRRPWRRTLLLLSPHIACMSLIPLRLLYIAEKVKGSSLDTANIIGSAYSRFEYAVTQLRVILSYLRMLILPYGQNMDPDYPLFRSLLNPEIIISMFVWAFILTAGVRLLWRRERSICTDLAGFSIFWFILSISVSSSVIPLTDLMFEHHTYLPSLAFFTGSTAYLFHLKEEGARLRQSAAICGCCMVVIVFGALTVKRNYVYHSKISIYTDTLNKSPNKDRANYSLGNEYFEKFQFDQAIPYLKRALELNPDNIQAYLSLGDSYRLMQQPEVAIELYKRYLETHPVQRKIQMNLAWTYAISGRLQEAIAATNTLLGIAKNDVNVLSFMAELNQKAGNIEEAQSYLGQAREAERMDGTANTSDRLKQLEMLIQRGKAP